MYPVVSALNNLKLDEDNSHSKRILPMRLPYERSTLNAEPDLIPEEHLLHIGYLHSKLTA